MFTVFRDSLNTGGTPYAAGETYAFNDAGLLEITTTAGKVTTFSPTAWFRVEETP